MPRPKKCRFIEHFPQVSVMKPIGLKCKDVKYNCLGLEEFEALRLADYERLKQIDAAEKMNISRSTFGRIVENARFIVADALLNGKGIIIKGGQICHDSIKLNNSSDDSDTSIPEKCNNCNKRKVILSILQNNIEIQDISNNDTN